jgi:undecaprenyl-diphosphatase
MSVAEAIILGIVEGGTEFLPISSTGHLILAEKLLGIPQTEFIKSFSIAIQLGAILSVAWLYGKRLYLDKALSRNVLIAFIPTGAIGFLLYPFAKQFLLGNDNVVVWSLIIGGIILILFEKGLQGRSKPLAENVSLKHAFIVGICQALAIIPGVSRAGATIIGGLTLGIERARIVEFSFLLAIPTIAAATALDLIKSPLPSSDEVGILIVGFLASAGAAFFAVRWLIQYVQTNSFVGFGIYRIAVGVLFLVLG